ncbi:hypothetical protein NA78x_002558 [Anatilimnocola sp. NA78]|uniref:hypothetical protein n=1 Tax=Anatilimnocola sp. NA78 TaxID=3415683 RepID=UPI003CE4C1CC
MNFRQIPRFGLRTLFVVVTIACVAGAYCAKSFRGERYAHSTSYRLDGVMAHKAADYIRAELNKLPDHTLTDETLFKFERRFNGAAFIDMERVDPEVVYARLRLPDGKITLVGFWIYPSTPALSYPFPRTDVTVAMLASESYFDIRSGEATKRELQRAILLRDTYSSMVWAGGSQLDIRKQVPSRK